MKHGILFLLCLVVAGASAQDTTFRWNLPLPQDAARVTASAFPGSDGVIFLKEQGYIEGPHTQSIFAMTNEMRVTTKAIIVKVFNASAIEKYGSFSYEYPDFRDKLFEHLFSVKARVMKPDGTIWVLPTGDITSVAGVTTGQGRALTKKVMFKIPNLAPNDIVQIEYAHAAPFSFRRQVLFFYHDRYPVLQSSVNITMTKQEHVTYLNFPPSLFPARSDTDLGKAVCSSWALRNLPAVPDEPYGRPFAEVSYLTSVLNQVTEKDSNGWRPIAKNYYKENLDRGSVSSSFLRKIGIEPSPDSVSWSDIEHAYTALRRYFTLSASNDITTDYDHVDKRIDEKEGDATDVAFLMMKILDRWKVPTLPVLLRDRREGVYELTVPSLVWFDRLGLVVTWKGKQMLYDFDRCIPNTYEVPWFLTPTMMFSVSDTGGNHLETNFPSRWQDHISFETHNIYLHPGKKATDSVEFTLHGAMAEELRGDLYSLVGDPLNKAVRAYLEKYSLQEADSASINAFRDEPALTMSGSGTSQAASASIDSFLTFKPKNHLARALREEFSSIQRHYDVFLHQPFALSLSWRVHLPSGYDIARLPEPIDIAGPQGVTAQVLWMRQGDDITIKADILFNTSRVPLEKYMEWRAFLENTNAAVEQELAFRKK